MSDDFETESDSDQTYDRDSDRNDAKTADDILLRVAPGRAQRASAKLRELLAGTLQVSITDTKKRYQVSWQQDQMNVAQTNLSQGNDSASADCEISMTEKDLLRVSRGDLNPQIAMLSQRIKVAGKQGPAMYFFNLIAPRPQF